MSIEDKQLKSLEANLKKLEEKGPSNKIQSAKDVYRLYEKQINRLLSKGHTPEEIVEAFKGADIKLSVSTLKLYIREVSKENKIIENNGETNNGVKATPYEYE